MAADTYDVIGAGPAGESSDRSRNRPRCSRLLNAACWIPTVAATSGVESPSMAHSTTGVSLGGEAAIGGRSRLTPPLTVRTYGRSAR
jgi:hypothetical protein